MLCYVYYAIIVIMHIVFFVRIIFAYDFDEFMHIITYILHIIIKMRYAAY